MEKKAAAKTAKDYGLEIEKTYGQLSGVIEILRAIRYALGETSEFCDGLATVERLIDAEFNKLWDISNGLQEMEA